MPIQPSTVLLVAPTDAFAARAASDLRRAGLEVTRVLSFAAARVRLDSHPDLLVSELRLREHNGLHLALRAQVHGIPAIVIGEEHPATRRDAAEVGAVFIPEECSSEALCEAVRATGVLGDNSDGRTHAA